MLIVCPSCATSYNVDAASVAPGGRRVRCVRCATVWHAELSQASRLMAAADALAPVGRMVEALTEVSTGAAGVTPLAEAIPSRDEGDGPDGAAAERQAERPEPRGAGSGSEPRDIPQLDFAAPPITPSATPVAAMDEIGDATGEATVMPSAALAAERAPLNEDSDEAAELIAHDLDEGFAPLDDVEHVAARRERQALNKPGRRWPLTLMQSVILALIVFDAVIVGWRVDFVRALPQTASFYAAIGLPVNLRGLAFGDLATSAEQHDGVSILVVQGDIANTSGRTAEIPHLRFAVRNAAHQEIYSWTAVPSRTMLPPGDAFAFHTRLASPPPDAHDVLVRFVNRYDITAGAR